MIIKKSGAANIQTLLKMFISHKFFLQENIFFAI